MEMGWSRGFNRRAAYVTDNVQTEPIPRALRGLGVCAKVGHQEPEGGKGRGAGYGCTSCRIRPKRGLGSGGRVVGRVRVELSHEGGWLGMECVGCDGEGSRARWDAGPMDTPRGPLFAEGYGENRAQASG